MEGLAARVLREAVEQESLEYCGSTLDWLRKDLKPG